MKREKNDNQFIVCNRNSQIQIFKQSEGIRNTWCMRSVKMIDSGIPYHLKFLNLCALCLRTFNPPISKLLWPGITVPKDLSPTRSGWWWSICRRHSYQLIYIISYDRVCWHLPPSWSFSIQLQIAPLSISFFSKSPYQLFLRVDCIWPTPSFYLDWRSYSSTVIIALWLSTYLSTEENSLRSSTTTSRTQQCQFRYTAQFCFHRSRYVWYQLCAAYLYH